MPFNEKPGLSISHTAELGDRLLGVEAGILRLPRPAALASDIPYAPAPAPAWEPRVALLESQILVLMEALARAEANIAFEGHRRFVLLERLDQQDRHLRDLGLSVQALEDYRAAHSWSGRWARLLTWLRLR